MRTPTSSSPISAASLAATAAGRQASAMVLSPLMACPLASSPEVASSRARTSSPGPQAVASQERAALRKAVPSSGPPAPPTVAMRVVATTLRTPPGVAGRFPASWAASSLVTTALMPRSRLSPWSASPMARSSSVSSARFSAISSAARRTQSRAQAASKDILLPSRVLTGVGSRPDRRAPEGAGRPCGCDRALHGPDGSRHIPGRPEGRAETGRRGAHRPLAVPSSHAPCRLAR